DSNDTAQCPSDDRDYSPLALPLRTTAPPDSNGTARVHLLAEGPLGSSDPASPYFLDVGALSASPYSAADAGYFLPSSAACGSLMVTTRDGDRRTVRGWVNVARGTVVFDGWDSGDGNKANALLARFLWMLDLGSPWPLASECPALPPPPATPTASATASRTPPPSSTPSRTPAATAVPTPSPTSVPRSSTPTTT